MSQAAHAAGFYLNKARQGEQVTRFRVFFGGTAEDFPVFRSVQQEL